MKSLAALFVVVAAGAACLAVWPVTARAQTSFTHCTDAISHQGGMTYRARHVVQEHTSCATARGLTTSYFLAITETTHGNRTRQGVCYPQDAYGVCNLVYRGGSYYCDHYTAVPQKTRGLVRCGRNGARFHKVRISFNVGF